MRPYPVVNDSTTIALDEHPQKGIKLYFYTLVISIFMISSCVYDPPRPRVEICNKTDRNFMVELFFDREIYKERWTEHDFKVFLTYSYARADDGYLKELISTDTVNLVQRYSLSPDSSLGISGWGDKDKSVLFNKIKVIKNQDTIVYGNIDVIKKSFVRIDRYLSRLVIN